MTGKKIDEILASEETLVPSSGFLSSVMERVNQEAAAPQPIPFPWRRAVPGIVLVAGVFGWGGFELLRHGIAVRHDVAFSPAIGGLASALHRALGAGLPIEPLGWMALSAALTWVSWLAASRMAGRSGLM